MVVSPSTRLPRAARPSSRFANLVLGTDPKRRGTVQVSLFAAAVYAACIGLVWFCYHFGLMARQSVPWMVGGLLITMVVIYAALRSGWSMRFRDPTLTVFQMGLAITWDCLSYAAIREAHAGMLMLIELSMLFGIFSLRAQDARALLAYTLALAGGVMLFKSITNPAIYAPPQQAIYFVALVLATSMIAWLASHLTSMRRKLESQRQELTGALDHIREISSRDALTGLHNRRHMLEMITHEVERHKRFKQGFCLALVDLDHFKQVNDQHGHQTGDAALRCFAQHAQQAIRPGDVLARWGGEEFMLLCPEAGPQDAITSLEALRKRLNDAVVDPTLPSLRVRFSAGLTAYVTAEPFAQTIERADQALYAAKAQGRGRCEIRAENTV